MLIDSNRITYLLEKEKKDFLQQYEDYLEQLSSGSPKVKRSMANKDRVLLVVLAKFLRKHAGELNIPISDKLQAAEKLLPFAKQLIKAEHAQDSFTTQEH